MGKLISVIIPAYNRCEYLKKCVQSVQNQTYSHWECIIVDDSSTDNTFSYFSSLSEKDTRIRVIRNERSKGAQGARNTGIHNAIGEWIAFLDSDNTFHPTKLSECVSIVDIDPRVNVVSHFSQLVNARGERKGRFDWLSNGHCHREILSMRSYVDFSQTFVSREKIIAMGDLDEQCPSYQEWDTHIRLSSLNAYYFTIEKELNNYLSDEGGDRISTNPEKEWKGFYYLLKKYRPLWKEQGINDIYCKLVIVGIRKSIFLKGLSAKLLAFRYLSLYPPVIYRIFPLLLTKYTK